MTITTQPGEYYKVVDGVNTYNNLSPIDVINFVKIYLIRNTDDSRIIALDPPEHLEELMQQNNG